MTLLLGTVACGDDGSGITATDGDVAETDIDVSDEELARISGED